MGNPLPIFAGRFWALLIAFVASIGVASAQVTPLSVAGDDIIFNSVNSDTVENGPLIIPNFTLTSESYITAIADYHFNFGGGATPGTIGLFSNTTSTLIGTWNAFSGSSTHPNQWWVVSPDVELLAGNYSIIDSDVSTWSFSTTNNFSADGTGPNWAPNVGMAQVAVGQVPEPSRFAAILGIASLVVAIIRQRFGRLTA